MLNNIELNSLYSKEEIILILISRLYFGKCLCSDVEDFIANEKISWEEVYKIASEHGIRSFIYSVVINHHLVIDNEVKKRFKRFYNNTKVKNFNQLRFASNLFNVFKEEGVNVIPYKGVFFAVDYYSDWAARESVDVDFLIDKKDALFIENYCKTKSYSGLTTIPTNYLNYHQRFFKDLVYLVPSIKSSLEIHWRLLDRFSGKFPTYNFFIPHMQPYQKDDLKIDKLLPTYDFLIMASNHYVKDLSIKFKSLIDMACIVTQKGDLIDSNVIKSCAKKFEFEKRLNLGLDLLDDILGINFLVSSRERLSAEQLRMPLSVKLPRLYIDEPNFIRLSLKLQDNFFCKIKFLCRCFAYYLLPTYTDINESRASNYGLPILFLMRPFRIVYHAFKR